MPAMSHVEYAKDSDKDSKGTIRTFVEESDILRTLDVKTTKEGIYVVYREATLGGAAFRNIGQSWTPSAGTKTRIAFPLFIAGGEIDVDIAIVRRHGETRLMEEEDKKIRNVARLITSTILQGDHQSDNTEFDGWQTLIVGARVLSNNSGSGGGALSLTKLDQAIDDTRNPTHLVMNRTQRLKFDVASRDTGITGFQMRYDEDMGRAIAKYRGLPFLVGYEAGPDDNILPYTEAASGGGSSVCSSIYVINATDDDGTFLAETQPLQAARLDSGPLGIQASPVHRLRIEHDLGLVVGDVYKSKRLRDITDAAIVD